jgi:F-type H+-transporting ATPase subunit delta
MPNPRLASRYAKSLIDLAVETGQLDVIFHDLKLLNEVSVSNRDFVNFIKSPVISADKKEKIFHVLFDGRVSELMEKFCNLLIRKGRESSLPEIARAGMQQFRQIREIRQVKITTAVPMDKALTEDLMDRIKSEIPDREIELETAVNADLIGGFVLETENTVFDASVLRDLKDIGKQFTQNVYLSQIP